MTYIKFDFLTRENLFIFSKFLVKILHKCVFFSVSNISHALVTTHVAKSGFIQMILIVFHSCAGSFINKT